MGKFFWNIQGSSQCRDLGQYKWRLSYTFPLKIMSAVNVTLNPLALQFTNPSEWGIETQITTVAVLGITVGTIFFLRPNFKDENIHDLGGFPLINAWSFFTKRWNFICRHFKNTGGKMFRFRVIQVGVIDCFQKSYDFIRVSDSSIELSHLLENDPGNFFSTNEASIFRRAITFSWVDSQILTTST